MKTETTTLITITADDGKVFKRVSDGEILGNKLTLGKSDKAENYTEIDTPKEEEINE